MCPALGYELGEDCSVCRRAESHIFTKLSFIKAALSLMFRYFRKSLTIYLGVKGHTDSKHLCFYLVYFFRCVLSRCTIRLKKMQACEEKQPCCPFPGQAVNSPGVSG